jgi:hypothetical protein
MSGVQCEQQADRFQRVISSYAVHLHCFPNLSIPVDQLHWISTSAHRNVQILHPSSRHTRCKLPCRILQHSSNANQADIQTLPWPEIVRLVGEIRKHNPVTSLANGPSDALAELIGKDHKRITKLDAHDVAKCVTHSGV